MDKSFIQYFGHIAYTLIFFSFLVRKMMWLRLLAITAGCFSIAFNYYVPAKPLWIPIQWNCLFIATNIIQISLLLLEKRQLTFKGDMKYLYENVFQNFSPVEFKKIIDLGYLRTSKSGFKLVDMNEDLGGIILILEGAASINVDNSEVATLREGKFIGEMSYLTGDKTRADVEAKTKLRYYVWDKEKLNSYLTKNQGLMAKFTATLGRQVIEQLVEKSATKEVHKRVS